MPGHRPSGRPKSSSRFPERLNAMPGRGTRVSLRMPLATREEGDELLTMLAETVRQSLNTIEVQRQRFAKMRPVGRRND